jgi:hypothetical protein
LDALTFGSTEGTSTMPTTITRRCSLHTTAAGATPRVHAIADAQLPVVAVNLGPGADLYLDVETANELAEALRVAVIELDAAAEAATA